MKSSHTRRQFLWQILGGTAWLLLKEDLSAQTAVPEGHSLLLPHEDFIESLRSSLYHLRFDEERPRLLSKLATLQGPVRQVYEALFAYIELIVRRAEDSPHWQKTFEAKAEAALERLKQERQQTPELPLWQLFEGLVLGLKAGVALAVKNNYWQAYSAGKKAVQALEELQKRYPQFYDAQLSAAMLKILIAQLPWMARSLAPLILSEGDLEGGLQQLEQVRQKARYVQPEARFFQLFVIAGDLPDPIRQALLPQVITLLKDYPENPQIYFFIANAYLRLGLHPQARTYALMGLRQVQSNSSQFVQRYRLPLQAYLLRAYYRSLLQTREWAFLREQTQMMADPSGVSAAYRAYALLKLGEIQASQKLAQETFQQLQERKIEMPWFMAPYRFSMQDSLMKFLSEHVLQAMKPRSTLESERQN